MKDLGRNSGAMTALAGRGYSWETGSGDERTGSGTDLEALSRASGTDTELDSDGPSWTTRADTGLDWGAATDGVLEEQALELDQTLEASGPELWLRELVAQYWPVW